MPAVAVEGDVVATPGSVLHTDTSVGSGSSSPAGTWSAGSVSYSTYPGLKSAGKPAIWKAECTFSFSGTNTSGAAVNQTEKVTLTASTQPLNPGQNDVLVDGDTESSTVYKNQLKATASGPLTIG